MGGHNFRRGGSDRMVSEQNRKIGGQNHTCAPKSIRPRIHEERWNLGFQTRP